MNLTQSQLDGLCNGAPKESKFENNFAKFGSRIIFPHLDKYRAGLHIKQIDTIWKVYNYV